MCALAAVVEDANLEPAKRAQPQGQARASEAVAFYALRNTHTLLLYVCTDGLDARSFRSRAANVLPGHTPAPGRGPGLDTVRPLALYLSDSLAVAEGEQLSARIGDICDALSVFVCLTSAVVGESSPSPFVASAAWPATGLMVSLLARCCGSALAEP